VFSEIYILNLSVYKNHKRIKIKIFISNYRLIVDPNVAPLKNIVSNAGGLSVFTCNGIEDSKFSRGFFVLYFYDCSSF